MKKWRLNRQILIEFIKNYYIVLLIFLIGGVGIIFIVRHRQVDTSAANVLKTDCNKVASDTKFTCWDQRLTALTNTQSPDAAFKELKAAYQTDQYVVAECHQFAHRIGRAAVNKYPAVYDAFSHGDNFCWSGYYHGVMEAVSSKLGKTKLVAQINDICSSLRKTQPYSFYHYNCVHGLGHGVMGITSNQLFESLDICDTLQNSWEQESCFGGAFMENIMSEDNPTHRTTYLRKDEPMYPCTAVATKYKQQCYLMQSSYALKLDNYDFSKVFAQCEAVDAAFVATCYQSVGRDASGNSVSDVTRTHDTCLLGQTVEAQQNCVIGAVKDFISYYHDISKAQTLCDSFASDSTRTLCHQTATDYYKSF